MGERGVGMRGRMLSGATLPVAASLLIGLIAAPASAQTPDAAPAASPASQASTADPEREKRTLLYAARHADPEILAAIEVGRLPQEEARLRAGLATREKAKGGDGTEWADEAERLAQILVYTRRAKDAEPLLRRAVMIRETSKDAAAHGRALVRLAEALNENLGAKAAELVARRAIVILTPLADREDLQARAWAQLSASIANQGHYAEALAAATRAQDLARRAGGDNAGLITAIETDLRGRRSAMDYSVSSEARLRTKLAELRQANPAPTAEIADHLGLLADAIGAQGRYGDAIAVARERLALRNSLDGNAAAPSIETRVARREVEEFERRRLIADAVQGGLTFGAAITARSADAGGSTKRAESYTPAEIAGLIEASRFAEAERVLRARVKSNRRTAETADDLEMLGQVLSSTGGDTEAARLLEQLVALRERQGEPLATARAYWRLSYALNGTGDYREAESAARRAIALASPLTGPKVPLAAAQTQLGASLAGQNRRPEAALAFQRAIEIARARPGEDTVLIVADINNSLALNLQEMGNLAEAESIYRANLEALTAKSGRGSAEVARTLGLLANLLDRLGRTGEAEVAQIEAIAIRERVLGTLDPQTIRSLSNYVGLLTGQQRNTEALELQQRIVKLRAMLPETRAEDKVIDLARMGEILENLKQLDEAIVYRRRAFAVARDELEPQHRFRAITTRSLAFALMSRDKTDREYVTLMRDAVERTRRDRARIAAGSGAPRADRALAAALSDTGRLNRTAFDTYRNALGLNGTFATYNRSAEAEMREASFTIAQDLATTEAGRAFSAIAVREALGDSERGRLVRRQQDLATALRAKDRELVVASTGSSETAKTLRSEIEALGVELAAVDARLRREFPKYMRLIAPAALTAAEVRKRLKPGEGVLLIVKSSYYTLSFVVTPDAFDWSASQTMLNEDRISIARVRCDVDPLTCPAGMKPSPVFDRVTAHELYRQLIQPLETALTGVRTLYVTTSGDLSDLPFATLLTAKPEGPDTPEAMLDAPWLGNRYALVSLPSVAALRATERVPRARGENGFVGYGAPVLADAGEARAVPAALTAKMEASDSALADPARLKELPSLPGTEVELRAMANVLGPGNSTIHLGTNATEAAVRADPQIADARILAFATHGLLPGELEGFAEPGLVFTPPAQATPADDGVLSASEVAAMSLNADFVILSACNTATAAGSDTSGSGGGDALSALARAFLYAGADALLASRWRVGDTVTAVLTVETLANVRADPRGDRAAALQRAMRAIRTGKRADGSAVPGWSLDWAHPSAWAPFSLISDVN